MNVRSIIVGLLILFTLYFTACCIQGSLYFALSPGMKDWVRYNLNDKVIFESNLGNKDTLIITQFKDSTYVTSGSVECDPEEFEQKFATLKLNSDSNFLIRVAVETNKVIVKTQIGKFTWDDSEKKFNESSFSYFKSEYYKSVIIDSVEYFSVFFIPAKINDKHAILYYNREFGLFRYATIDKQIWRKQ